MESVISTYVKSTSYSVLPLKDKVICVVSFPKAFVPVGKSILVKQIKIQRKDNVIKSSELAKDLSENMNKIT